MKKMIGLMLVGLAMAGCGSGGGSGGGTPASGPGITSLSSPLVGQTYYLEVLKNAAPYYSLFKVIDATNIQIAYVYFTNPSAAVGYYRKSIGTYTISGNQIQINYSYETCNPVHTETVTLNYTDASDRVFVQSGVTTLQYLNTAKWTTADNTNAVGLVEDINCNQIPN